MEIWETIGFWHYPIPGLFLLAQFCLGVLVAIGNLVNNSVFQYLSGEGGGSSNDDHTVEGKFDIWLSVCISNPLIQYLLAYVFIKFS